MLLGFDSLIELFGLRVCLCLLLRRQHSVSADCTHKSSKLSSYCAVIFTIYLLISCMLMTRRLLLLSLVLRVKLACLHRAVDTYVTVDVCL